MQLKLDREKTYAIALEGGGAKGAYEIGVWQALDEAGIKYKAVSGCSVGALNGSLMAMRDLKRAVEVWSDMRLSKVIDLDEDEEANLSRAMNGEFELEDIHELIAQALDIIRNRGLDISPLREWMREVVDVRRIKESDVELFISTVSISDRKSLEIKINELPEEQICDMLLASAYHPSFRLERIGGKYYADGGFADTLPLHVLVSHGYKDIIAVRIPGIGWEKRFKLPEDVNITTIHTNSDLGFVLNFDAEVSKRNMRIGYLDAKRTLYGLYGRRYYIDRSLGERQALELLLDRFAEGEDSLRLLCEKELPRLARKLDVERGDYYELLIAMLEKDAQERELDTMRIYEDRELIDLVGR